MAKLFGIQCSLSRFGLSSKHKFPCYLLYSWLGTALSNSTFQAQIVIVFLQKAPRQDPETYLYMRNSGAGTDQMENYAREQNCIFMWSRWRNKIVLCIKVWDCSTGKTISDLTFLSFLFLLERFHYITNEITINRNNDQLLKISPSYFAFPSFFNVCSLLRDGGWNNQFMVWEAVIFSACNDDGKQTTCIVHEGRTRNEMLFRQRILMSSN